MFMMVKMKVSQTTAESRNKTLNSTKMTTKILMTLNLEDSDVYLLKMLRN